LFGAGGIGIHNAGQLRAFKFTIHAGMIPAEIPRADNGDADCFLLGS
jgi:hypothetical protein